MSSFKNMQGVPFNVGDKVRYRQNHELIDNDRPIFLSLNKMRVGYDSVGIVLESNQWTTVVDFPTAKNQLCTTKYLIKVEEEPDFKFSDRLYSLTEELWNLAESVESLYNKLYQLEAEFYALGQELEEKELENQLETE